MRRVYRYPLALTDLQTVMMPSGAHILHVARREGTADKIHLWALIDPGAEPEARRIRIAGTGHPLENDDLDYIGSIQIARGALVFHVFEIVAAVQDATISSPPRLHA